MMNIDFITATVLDGAFAAVAAIGFAIISNPPRKAILISAFLAAVGHGLRYFLMHAHLFTMDIATASFFAAVSIGLLAIPFAKAIHCPAEVFSFPSLLPMIPGMFAYKSILALTKFMQTKDETDSLRYLVDFLPQWQYHHLRFICLGRRGSRTGIHLPPPIIHSYPFTEKVGKKRMTAFIL